MNARWPAIALPAVVLMSALAIGQDAPVPSSGKTPLGVRQQRVERLMEDLERKFKVLAQTLQQSEPERAERIVKTLQESKQLLVQQRMAEIVKLLDQSQLEGATTGQGQVLLDIKKLIGLLLDEQNDRDKKLEEWKQLQQWKEEIQKLLEEERPQKAESDRLANKEQTLADLAAQIKAVEALIKAQEKVNQETGEARPKGPQALGKAAGQQAKVREQTEKTADMVAGKKPGEAKPGEGKPGESKPSEAKPAEAKPGEGKPGEGKPGEGKPGEGKPGEAKPGEAKPGEGKSGEGKPGEGKPGEGQPGEGAGGQPAPKQPPAPGEKSLRDAAKNQQSAEKNLETGKGKAGEEDQQRALADLKRALDELKKEESRIASLPPEEFKKMADKQADTAQKTARLQEKMQKAEDAAGGEGGGSGKPGSGGKKSPGKKSVQQAQKNMEDASGDLGKQDPGEASRDQDKAIKDLEKALQEIEERLAQLREETQLEKLARLEARFREMLARQQAVSKDTIEMDKKRIANGGELKRADRLGVGKLAAEERELAEAAQVAYDIIYEDGTSVVFPEIVSQLRDDLVAVGQLLDTQKVDSYPQSLQKEIEITLEELIEALQKAQQQKEGGGGGGGGGGEEPLLPNSAELKLLRLSQLRVNRRTESFDKSRPKTELEPVLKQEVMNISQRQAEIADMTIRILERAQQ